MSDAANCPALDFYVHSAARLLHSDFLKSPGVRLSDVSFKAELAGEKVAEWTARAGAESDAAADAIGDAAREVLRPMRWRPARSEPEFFVSPPCALTRCSIASPRRRRCALYMTRSAAHGTGSPPVSEPACSGSLGRPAISRLRGAISAPRSSIKPSKL